MGAQPHRIIRNVVTPKQRANIQRIRAQRAVAARPPAVPVALTERPWWATAPQEGFTALAASHTVPDQTSYRREEGDA